MIESIYPLSRRPVLAKIAFITLACFSLCTVAFAKKKPADPAPAAVPSALTIREVHYSGTLSDDEARFVLTVNADATDAGAAVLLEGDVAVLSPDLPDSLKLRRDGNRYTLIASHAGHFKFDLPVAVKIQRVEPWNQITFTGPAAIIASMTARAAGPDTEVQMLSGTLLESARTNGMGFATGFLGPDKVVSLRWSRNGGVSSVTHKAMLTVDSQIAAQVTPTAIKYTSAFHYTIVQGNASELTLALPASQAMTKLDGEQIRDWRLTVDGDRQLLTVAFIKPVENSYDLKIYSEQSVDNTNATLNPPQPLNVERETGSLAVSVEDELVEIAPAATLRQVNATGNAIAAYVFNARPLTLALKLKPIEPVISAADRVTAQLEEARLMVLHRVALTVEKAGIYTIEMIPADGFAVADVRGDGVEDWTYTGGRIHVNFSTRVLGARQLEVQLEKSLKSFPDRIVIEPLRVGGAVKETAQIGAASEPGIELRTAALSGLREIPVNRLSQRTTEILAYVADQPDWALSITSEKLSAHVVADIFNLVTVGDGIIGGSATIRYGLANQGVQEFKVRVPAEYKNIDFTGPNIRNKSFSNDVWTIDLQDKVWGGYTLVITYDAQFDAKGATLHAAGIHAEDVERETGTIAITTAASLEINPTASDQLRRIDESDLSDIDRSFITRPVVYAWQYGQSDYDLSFAVKRYSELQVLDAAADRTQITSVLTEAGQMLTQASFMVKNNDKQFQRFQLPQNATLWGCYVNNQPARPELDGDWVLVALPRDADRDQSFAVDIVYAQTNSMISGLFGKKLALAAPRTDMQSTYAEWQLFAPTTFRLSNFGGNMSVAQGTTYELLDAWQKFLAFYVDVLREAGGAILVFGLLSFLVIALVVSAVRRGWNGILTLLGVVFIFVILAGMLLPALSAAKRKAQRINSVSNLNQIGLAIKVFAGDNNNRLPASFNDMTNELNSDKVTYDVETGERFTYLGAGLSFDTLRDDSVLAYSPVVNGHCEVLMADGSVQQISAQKFAEYSQRGFIQYARPTEVAESQRLAIAHSAAVGGFGGTMSPQPSAVTAAPASAGAGVAVNVADENGRTFNPDRVTTPMAAGIHSLRIELPQIGQPFLFTKVLNVRDEPLSIHAKVLATHTFQAMQMAWQTAAFLIGLGLWWVQWRKTDRNSFILTVALTLIVGSVCSLLVEHRALHDALIVGFPIAVLAVISFLIWRYWPRTMSVKIEQPPVPPVTPPSGTPPVLALLVGLALIAPTALHAAEAPVSIISASYSGNVGDRVGLIDATLKLSAAEAGDIVPLFSDDVAIQKFSATGKATLVRQDNNIAVQLGSRGDVTLKIKMLVKISGDVARRRLAFAIPQALSSQVSFVLDEPEAGVDLPSAISLKRKFENDKTRVDAVVGSADRVEMLWTPRMKRANEIAATVFCENNSLVAFGNGVENIRSTLDYKITQGELRQARIQLPAGQKLLRVNGTTIRDWEVKNESDGQILVVNFLNGVSSAAQLTIETENNLGTAPANASVIVPHALDVKRETGLVALSSSEDLNLTVSAASGLQRVDAEEFPRLQPKETSRVTSVYQFSKPDFTLNVSASAIEPEIDAIARNSFQVGTEQLALKSTIDYTIKRAGVFALRVALPDGYRLESATGNGIEQQNERSQEGRRILEITLKERTIGNYRLNLELTRDFRELPKTLSLQGAHPLGMAKLTGFISIATEAGVGVRTEAVDGLTEIPATTLPDYSTIASAGSLLAYKFISPQPRDSAEWKLTAATESVTAWVRAEIASTYSFNETTVGGRALVRYDIANAPVKELRVRVPERFRNVEITGPNIRSKEQDGNVWRIGLQSPTRGIYTLTVTWDEPCPSKTNRFEITGISAEGSERETGVVAISVPKSVTALQISPVSSSELQQVDASDYPDWAGAPDSATALVYRYVHPGYQLVVDRRRLEDATVLQALVDSAEFTSVVAEDGQMMTEVSLSLRSNGRQFLEVELPHGITERSIWSAFVAGQAVRPSLRDGKLLLPIQQSGSDDGEMLVQLIYVSTNTFPRANGAIGFVSPTFSMPIKNARWEFYLPQDYAYNKFSGSMNRDISSISASGISSFSSLDYSRMEQEKKSAAKAEAMHDIDEARRLLSEGNVREANASYSRALKFDAGDIPGEDAKQLQKDLQKAQASNLIAAQSDFAAHNTWQNRGGGGGGGNAPAQPPPQTALYDSIAAAQQTSKLKQAQEFAGAKIRPLHVNLPERGLRLAFTQVLQTEAGKPMTIGMYASNNRTVHWPTRIFAMAAAFGVLWGIVILLSRLTSRSRSV